MKSEVDQIKPEELSGSSQAKQMYQILLETYPDAHCELNYRNPFELLIGTILSAQSTDKRVNEVTQVLFGTYSEPEDLAAADLAEVEQIVKPTGLFRNKAAAIVATAGLICEKYGGQVPQDLAELVKLPGVGRKTANVVLGNAFGVPGLTPDTHFTRVTRRMGWVSETKPEKIERAVSKMFDPNCWVKLSHVLIWHGRRCCSARKPDCVCCPITRMCPKIGL